MRDGIIEPYEGRAYGLLEELYREYNRREYVSPDPLQFLYNYERASDREVVGLIASSLAYGRVASILSSVGRVLDALGPSPAEYLLGLARGKGAKNPSEVLADSLRGFVHRFTACDEMAKFLSGVGIALLNHGSLEKLFMDGMRGGINITAPMESFTDALLSYAGLASSHLLPRPSKGSACKRLCLYIRWMARDDDVDPGGWSGVPPSDIIVPLDTHMFRIATGLGFVTRKSADGLAAVEATEGFRRLRPDDPVRYDFALTRFGIRTGLSVDELLDMFNKSEVLI